MEETKVEEMEETRTNEMQETKTEEMEEDVEEKTKGTTEDKVEEEVDGVKEEASKEKESKKRPRTKSSAGKTAKTSTIERPVRERKSVERLVATIEKDSAKEFHIEKGRGTALKDIPNVAYKLSRRKGDDIFKLLHTILFGRRGKEAYLFLLGVLVPSQLLAACSVFRIRSELYGKANDKVKEKLDKCVKEKLVEFCDVLDIPISRANTRKEDIIAKLIEFLVAPHATTSELLSEKEQPSKGNKRKRVSKPASESNMPSKSSAKKDQRMKFLSKLKVRRRKKVNLKRNLTKDKGKQKRGSAKSPAKKGSAGKAKTKKETISKKASPPPKKAPSKSPPSRSKTNHDTAAKKSSGKKKDDSIKNSPTPKKSASKESTALGTSLENLSYEKKMLMKPVIAVILCGPVLNEMLTSVLFSMMLKIKFHVLLVYDESSTISAKHFNMDLTPRKSSIKLMIQDELAKLADADEADDEEDEEDAEKDEKKSSTQGVEA
ncbi:UNVERIFIED_CONTAM: hypothetical protein Scaly_1247400 [Sesamum calycinum]|uniref:Uncharacterized protein n=1 Tax=Sesamum calycinum TaxID=2727403 RepID=A0AAW2Q596_9LAMI